MHAEHGVRRELVETPWVMEEGRSGESFVGKMVVTAKGGDQKQYRTTNLLLLCGRSGFFTVGLTRDANPWNRPGAVALAWSGSEIKLSGRSQPQAAPGVAPKNMWTASATGIAAKEMWAASAPKALLENATFGDSIDLIETPAGTASAAPRRTPLSATGLASLIGMLAPRCP